MFLSQHVKRTVFALVLLSGLVVGPVSAAYAGSSASGVGSSEQSGQNQDGTGLSAVPVVWTVQYGHTLGTIAVVNCTTVSEIVSLNSATYPSLLTNPALIKPGWQLTLPPVPLGCGAVQQPGLPNPYTVQQGDDLSQIARAAGISVADLINLNAATYPTLRTNSNRIFPGWVLRLSGATTRAYTVRPGDRIYRIAVNNGTSVAVLVNLNATTYPSLLTNPALIQPGWVLTIPA